MMLSPVDIGLYGFFGMFGAVLGFGVSFALTVFFLGLVGFFDHYPKKKKDG